MLDDITRILQQIKSNSSFSAKRSTGAENLHIGLDSVGVLKFPLQPGVVKRIISTAKPATFGWRDKTCLDSKVRNVWKIPKSRVKIDKRQWSRHFNPALEQLKTDLGLPQESSLCAELHELLVYAPGQFFTPHQDSEKRDGMVATLVVTLPSQHKGGALVVDHQGNQKRYQSGRQASDKLSFVAFYADCQHQIRPVTEGYRVVLVYNLILKGGGKRIASPANPQAQRQLTQVLGNFFMPRTEDEQLGKANKLVYLLDYQYTPKGLSWTSLKEIDRLRASVLSEAASSLDLEIYLALADVKETWDCEVTNGGWGYGRRKRSWGYFDDEEPEENSDDVGIELGELIDGHTTLKHWRDAKGKPASLPEWSVDDLEICWNKATNEFSPFDTEYEGYMGNWGNTMERWYHRAAIILWRRSDRHAVLLSFAPELLIRELLQLAEKKATLQRARQHTRAVLPSWSSTNHSYRESSWFSTLLRLAWYLDDRSIARQLLSPMSAEVLSPKNVAAMVCLQKRYGNSWLIDVMQHWLAAPAYNPAGKPVRNLPQIIERWDVHTGTETDDPAHWLMERQLSTLQQQHRNKARIASPLSHLDKAASRVAGITELLQAAVARSDELIFQSTIDHLMASEEDYLLFDLVEISQAVKQLRYTGKDPEAKASKLLTFVRTKVQTALERPPRDAADWSISTKPTCNCADCNDLTAFLQSSDAGHLVWPMAKARRLHMHRTIDAMGIPVTHQTERRGSPHKLHLVKTRQLFRQDRQRRKRLQKSLDILTQ